MIRQLLLAVLLLLSTAALAEPRRAWTLPEPGHDVPVKVGLTILDIERLDASTSTYTVMGYFFYEWKDERLRFAQQEPDHFHLYHADEIWTPNLEIVNAVEYTELQPNEYLGHPDGTVLFKSHFVATLTTPLDLRKFPFDSQELRFMVEPFDRSSHQVRLVWDQAKTSLARDAFLDEWELSRALAATSTLSTADPSASAFSRLTFSLGMRRHAGYYIWKVVLQLTLLVILSWTVFYMAPEEIQTGLGVSVTLLLTVIAFGITTDSLLPKVGYRTWLDNFGQLCFCMIFAAAFETVLTYNRKSMRVRRGARLVFPLAFGLGLLGLGIGLL